MDNGLNGQNVNQVHQGQMVPYAGPMANPGMGSSGLVQILWQSWWLVLLSCILGVGGGFLYLKKLAPDPLYTSVSRLLVEVPPAEPGETSGVYDVGIASKKLQQTQAAVIMSRQIVGRALSDPNLLTLYGASDPNYVGDLAGTLFAAVGKNTDIIDVVAESPYPGDAAKFVNTVVRAYIQWHETNRKLGAMGTLNELRVQLDGYRKDLEDKRRALRRLAGIRDADTSDVRTAADELSMLKQQVLAARTAAETYRLYYEGLLRWETDPEGFRLYAMANKPQGFAVDDRGRVRLEGELLITQSQLEAVGPGAIVQRSVLAQLEERKTELEKEIETFDKEFVSSHLSLAKVYAEEKVDSADKLAKAYNEAKVNSTTANSAAGEYNDLLSECQILEALCNSHVQKISELKIRLPRGLKIHVLEEAVPAMMPSSMQTTRVLGIGLVLGAVLGSGLAFVRDSRDQRVRSADEITAILGVPVLGAIPTISRRLALSRGQRARFSSNSRESEACRALRTALFFGVPKHEAATLLITSPGAREGKTTLASNLGIAMANAGQKTLIIDADLRKPMQQRVFAMKDTGKGFTDLLAGTSDLNEAIRPSKVRGLDVLPSGPNVGNPSEMLNGPAFPAVLQRLRGMYDRIIIDSPPVGLVTDGQILAAMCDLTLVVLRAGQSTRQVTQRARDALYTVGARIAGAVVNDVSKRDHQYSHYSGYGYYYGGHSEGHKSTSKELPADVTPASEDGASVSGKKRWDNMFPQS